MRGIEAWAGNEVPFGRSSGVTIVLPTPVSALVSASSVTRSPADYAMANNLSVPANIPSLGSEGNLSRYLQEIRKFPMLAPEEEYMLAKRGREHGHRNPAHRPATSPLPPAAQLKI